MSQSYTLRTAYDSTPALDAEHHLHRLPRRVSTVHHPHTLPLKPLIINNPSHLQHDPGLHLRYSPRSWRKALQSTLPIRYSSSGPYVSGLAAIDKKRGYRDLAFAAVDVCVTQRMWYVNDGHVQTSRSRFSMISAASFEIWTKKNWIWCCAWHGSLVYHSCRGYCTPEVLMRSNSQVRLPYSLVVETWATASPRFMRRTILLHLASADRYVQRQRKKIPGYTHSVRVWTD